MPYHSGILLSVKVYNMNNVLVWHSDVYTAGANSVHVRHWVQKYSRKLYMNGGKIYVNVCNCMETVLKGEQTVSVI